MSNLKIGDEVMIMSCPKDSDFEDRVGKVGTISKATIFRADSSHVEFEDTSVIIPNSCLKFHENQSEAHPPAQKKIKSLEERSKELLKQPPKAKSLCDRLIMKNAALRSVLHKLVAAKDEKDTNGDSEKYRSMKEGLWGKAREVLNNNRH